MVDELSVRFSREKACGCVWMCGGMSFLYTLWVAMSHFNYSCHHYDHGFLQKDTIKQ